MVTKRRKVVKMEGTALLEGNIADTEDIYLYLGIPKANRNHEGVARKTTTTKYLQRVKQMLRGQED